ncbi:unnamed protein product [Gordionus sp. m RMFG-2023]
MHNVPKDSNTHFKIVIVCDNFENIPLIQRHRLINQILTDELKTTIHALSIVAQTSSQWNKNSIISKSPACLGGMLKDSHNRLGNSCKKS